MKEITRSTKALQKRRAHHRELDKFRTQVSQCPSKVRVCHGVVDATDSSQATVQQSRRSILNPSGGYRVRVVLCAGGSLVSEQWPGPSRLGNREAKVRGNSCEQQQRGCSAAMHARQRRELTRWVRFEMMTSATETTYSGAWY